MDRILLAFEGVPLSIDGGLLIFEGLSRELNFRTCDRPVPLGATWGMPPSGRSGGASMDAEIDGRFGTLAVGPAVHTGLPIQYTEALAYFC